MLVPAPRTRNAAAAKAPSRHEPALCASTLNFSYCLLTPPFLAFRLSPPRPPQMIMNR